MIKINAIRFYRSGEIVRDIGIVYLYKILNDSEENVILTNNFLEIKNVNTEKLYDLIINKKLFEIAINGINSELKKKKMDILDIKSININNYKSKIEKMNLKDKDKKDFLKKIENQYIPYLRNSGKFGANAQSVNNFHKNFKEIIDIVFNKYSDNELDSKYEKINTQCNICHSDEIYKYDITHKKEKKERTTSKYLYSFMGSEKNMFNNFGKDNSNKICFECEFLNIMFLFYINENRSKDLIYVENLKMIDFFNYQFNLSSNYLGEKGYLSNLSKYRNFKFRIYSLEIDSNKGVLVKLNSTLNILSLMKNLKLKTLIDNFHFSNDESNIKKILYLSVDYSNFNYVLFTFLNNLIYKEEGNFKRYTLENINIFLNFINIQNHEKEENKMPLETIKYFNDNNNFRASGYKLGQLIPDENKKTIIYKLNNYLKSQNRKGILETIIHLLATNSKITIPKDLADTIMNSKENDLYYNVGLFIEGLLQNKKNDKGE